MNQHLHTEIDTARKLEAMLKVSNSILGYHEFEILLKNVDEILHDLVEYDIINLFTYNESTGDGLIYYPGFIFEEISEHPKAVFTFADGPSFWVWKNQKPLINCIEDYEKKYPKVLPYRRGEGIQTSCVVPLTTPQKRVGTLEFLSRKKDAFVNQKEIPFIQFIANQVAIVIDNALIYRKIKTSEENLARERNRLQTLLDVTNAAFSQYDTKSLIREISLQIHRVFGAEFCGLILHNAATGELHWEAVHQVDMEFCLDLRHMPLQTGPVEAQCFTDRRPYKVDAAMMDVMCRQSDLAALLCKEGIRSFCTLPLSFHLESLGLLIVGHRVQKVLEDDSLQLLTEISKQVSMAVSNIQAYRKIVQLQKKLSSEKLYLEKEIKSQYNFGEIIGQSKKMQSLYQQIEVVAETDATVLILGETGTGKELIARTIHECSLRRKHTLIKVNSSSIPTNLFESDLFGHEKGAFTGAIQQKIGRFEMAHLGTLFLDEVGDILLESQPKLLRALQEQEFERLGGTRPIHVDVRIIAATNRNLLRMVDEGEFRSDLYYRLNIFPIKVPPLRERKEDIPMLIYYFVEKYAQKLRRNIKTIPEEIIESFMQMPWPGNVRELGHVIERAVVISKGPMLQMPQDVLSNFFPVANQEIPLRPMFQTPVQPSSPKEGATLHDMERRHILNILHECNGVIGGDKGAAARLGLKRTTLHAKMKRLGIVRNRTEFYNI